jgi:hypothetical protein
MNIMPLMATQLEYPGYEVDDWGSVPIKEGTYHIALQPE